MYSGILIALVPLALGYLIKISQPAKLHTINRSLTLMIYAILFLMGASLAQLDDLGGNVQSIGHYTLVLFICTFGVNFLFLAALDLSLPRPKMSVAREQSSRIKMIFESLQVCCSLLLGFVIGLIPLPIWQTTTLLSELILILLLFLIGIQLRSSHITLRQILFNKIGLLTTFIVIISALLGGALAAYLLNLPIRMGLAMSSGFGWYSLSGILMTDAHGPIIGSASFLNDILRELMAIMLIPSLMKRLRLTALGLCGATSMDFTLPMLQKEGGMAIVPPAIVQGFLLTLVMPVLMTLFNYY